MKKLIPAASALLLAATLLASCGNTGAPVLTYGDSVITENQFTYYLATYKASFISSYADVEDTAEFYAHVLPNGQTGEEYLFSETVSNVSLSLICGELFDQMQLTLDPAVTETVDAYVQSFIDDYVGGDKRVLNSELATLGLNVKMLREIYLLEEKGTALYEHLYGENGTIGVTDAELDAYCRENYARVRHLYVNNAYTYETTADGYIVTDENGSYVTRPLTEEELAAKNSVIAAIDGELANGGDFEALYETFSEDRYYENGYYLTRGMDFIDEVEISAFELAEGEWTKVTSDVGTHYIMRLPMNDAPWTDEKNADFFRDYREEVGFQAFVAYVRQFLPDVVKDEEKLAEFTVKDSPMNYRF